MINLKLTIDLLPKGAWGNNLSSILPKKDWDTLREFCYEKAKHKCEICGESGDLDAHEEWNFDTKSKTQTLKNIIALCSACHGVKHFRNSTRIGYGDSAKAHFLKINKCSPIAFASHYAEAQLLFEERNEVLRWKLKADLSRFGGKRIEVKERNIPFINNPYDNIDWATVNRIKVAKSSSSSIYAVLLLSDEEVNCRKVKKATGYFTADNIGENTEVAFRQSPFPPEVSSIDVNNYEGAITVVSAYANKIEWVCGDEILKTKYNTGGKFTTTFKVEDLEDSLISFRLIGSFGETHSQVFELYSIA